MGDLTDSGQLTHVTRGVCCEGSYASQLMRDKKGQLIHLAWVITNNHHGWNGYLTLPSVLHVSKEGVLKREPVSELQKLRAGKSEWKKTAVTGELNLSSGELLEVIAKVKWGDAKEFGVRFRRSSDGATAETLTYPANGKELNLHLFLDRGAIDEYVGDGSLTRHRQFSPKPADLGLSVFANGGTAQIESMQVYRLRPAKFTAYP